MSEVKWTEYQQKAIDAFGKGTAVSAAAGSGKTAVLIERMVRLLCDESKNIPADTVLAVTFTKDAANQMRDKLNKAFDKKIAEHPDDRWLLQQQNLLQLARVSTINSFCLDLVKDNLHKFEFQGGLKILEDSDRKLIFDKAYNQAMDELCSTNKEEYELLYDSFHASKDYRKIVVEKLFNFIRTISSRKRWIKLAEANYSDDEKFERLTGDIWKSAEELLTEAEKALEKYEVMLYYNLELDKVFTAQDNISMLLDNYEMMRNNLFGLRKFVGSKDWKGISEFTVQQLKPFRLKGAASKVPELKAIFEDVKNEAKALADIVKTCCEDVKKLFPFSEEHCRLNMKKALNIFRVLYKLALRIEQISYEMKVEKNSIEFSDAELMAKELLVVETEDGFERTELAEEIRKSGMYRIIVIDEFQDVNNLQELIFRAISDSDDLEIMGKNIFFVGDMKQAIYKFRLTNPELFKNDLRQARDEANSEYLQAINLNKNFRSRKEIIGFSNFVFSQIMSAECGDVDYDEKERLEFGATYTEREEPVEIMLVNKHSDYDRSLGFPEGLLAAAQRIKELIDSGAPVCDGGVDRKCRASDFCVLVNRNDDKKAMSKALQTVGLKAICEDKKGYIKSREISLALDMLRVVDSPMNDIALTAVMLSPIFGFTADEAAIIRQKCKSEGRGYTNHIYQVITAAAKDKTDDSGREAEYIDLGSEVLQEKCRTLYKLTETLRYESMSMSLERFIRRMFDVTDLMALTALYLDSDKKRANLRLLLEYASSYEKNGREGITGFLHYVDSVSDNENAFKQAASVVNSGDTVNVQTFHASKGLEYPFVFLCTLDSKLISDNNDEHCINLSNEHGVSFDFIEKSLNVKRENLYHRYLEQQNVFDNKSERMRILYVGCTRARERLVIVYDLNFTWNSSLRNAKNKKAALLMQNINGERIPPAIVKNCNTMTDWLTLALAKHPDRDVFAKWLGADVSKIEIDRSGENAKIVFNEFEPYMPSCEIHEEKKKHSAPDANIVMKLRKNYTFEYDYSNSFLPAKLTVTEIVRNEKEKNLGKKNPEFFPNLPRLNEELDKLTAAEKGTFTHKFMELANYSNAECGVRSELERLVSKGFFTPKEAGGVYVERLEEFFSGDFYKRMKASDDLRREQKFLVEAGDLHLSEELGGVIGGDGMIQGIADCIFKESDGWVLVDYKTDNFRSEEEMSEYGTQLMLYKAAFELIYGEKVKSSYIYSFKLGVGKEFLF